MLNLFLQGLGTTLSSNRIDTAGMTHLAGLLAVITALAVVFLVILFIICVGVWLYTSFAYMAIAKKAKLKSPSSGIAFIPIIGPAILSSKIAKMHWWPILLLIGIIIPFVNWLFMLAFTIFMIVWMWKTFEAIKKPGWWAILMIIPLVNIIYLILLGVAAWSKR